MSSEEQYLLSLLNNSSNRDYRAEETYINQKYCPFVKYFRDRVSVKYIGKGLIYNDITVLQAFLLVFLLSVFATRTVSLGCKLILSTFAKSTHSDLEPRTKNKEEQFQAGPLRRRIPFFHLSQILFHIDTDLKKTHKK